MYTNGNKFYFVEIDNKQAMTTNLDKIKKYGEFFKEMFNQYKAHPTLIWKVNSDVKSERLGKECSKNKINYQIY